MTGLPNDDRALRRLDEADLEVLRLRALRDGDDDRYSAILDHLVVRAVPVVDRVCRRRGAEIGLAATEIRLAVEDTWAQLLLRLHRQDPLPPVSGIAADIAAKSVDNQPLRSPTTPRLASRRPELRVVRPDHGDVNHRNNGDGRSPS